MRAVFLVILALFQFLPQSQTWKRSPLLQPGALGSQGHQTPHRVHKGAPEVRLAQGVGQPPASERGRNQDCFSGFCVLGFCFRSTSTNTRSRLVGFYCGCFVCFPVCIENPPLS